MYIGKEAHRDQISRISINNENNGHFQLGEFIIRSGVECCLKQF